MEPGEDPVAQDTVEAAVIVANGLMEHAFYYVWFHLALKGECDDYGGTEFRRVLEIWQNYYRRWNLAEFIRDHVHDEPFEPRGDGPDDEGWHTIADF